MRLWAFTLMQAPRNSNNKFQYFEQLENFEVIEIRKNDQPRYFENRDGAIRR